MINDYLKTGLPFYDNIKKQDRYKEGCYCGLDCTFRLPSPSNALLPFQIEKPVIANDVVIQWKIHNMDGSVAMNISNNIPKLQRTTNGDGRENIIYHGNVLEFAFNNGATEDLSMCDGFYYSTVKFGSGTYYSEVFYVDTSVALSDYLKIEWGGGCKIGRIDYSSGYKNTIYLDAELSRNTPSVEEEGEEIEGNFVPVTIRYINNYRIETIVPEFILEAINSLSLYPNVQITLKGNLYSTVASKINVTSIDWDELSCMAVTEIKFQQSEEMAFKACC